MPSGHNRRRRLATRSSGKQQAGRTAVRDAPIVCPEESPLLASTGDNFAARNSPWRGLTRRLRRGGRACSPMGRSIASIDEPEFRQTTSGAHGSAGRADCLPRGKPPACSSTRQLCCKKSPRRGLTRRLRRGSGTCRSKGRSHFSFDGERKVCKRKPAARRLREKALDCPF